MTLEKLHYIKLRRAIGIIAMSFYPLCLIIGLLFGNGRNQAYWWQTLSSQYYSNSKIIYIGAMFTMFVFFCLYKGYDWKDRLVNISCGLSMILNIIFPSGGITNTTEERNLLVSEGMFDINMNVSHLIHCISGLLIFVTFYINIRLLFTRHDDEVTEQKEKRNKWYKILATIVLISELIACTVTYPNNFGISNKVSFTQYIPTVCTALSLVAIGIAWLIKGEAIKVLNDE